MSFVSKRFLKSTRKAGLWVILHILVSDTKTFQQHSWIMLRLKLPFSCTGKTGTWRTFDRRDKKSENTQRKITKMKKENKSNEISAMCLCPYILFLLAIKIQDTHCQNKRLHRECSSLLLLLRNAVQAFQSTDTWICSFKYRCILRLEIHFHLK